MAVSWVNDESFGKQAEIRLATGDSAGCGHRRRPGTAIPR